MATGTDDVAVEDRPDPDRRGAMVLPSHDEPLVRELSTLIGGRTGRFARIGESRWFITPLRVLIALTPATVAALASIRVPGRSKRSVSRIAIGTPASRHGARLT